MVKVAKGRKGKRMKGKERAVQSVDQEGVRRQGKQGGRGKERCVVLPCHGSDWLASGGGQNKTVSRPDSYFR